MYTGDSTFYNVLMTTTTTTLKVVQPLGEKGHWFAVGIRSKDECFYAKLMVPANAPRSQALVAAAEFAKAP